MGESLIPKLSGELCFLTSFQVQTFHVCHQKMGWMGPCSSDQFWPSWSWCNSESDWYINPSENGGMVIPELMANQSVILLVLSFRKFQSFTGFPSSWIMITKQIGDYDHVFWPTNSWWHPGQGVLKHQVICLFLKMVAPHLSSIEK